MIDRVRHVSCQQDTEPKTTLALAALANCSHSSSRMGLHPVWPLLRMPGRLRSSLTPPSHKEKSSSPPALGGKQAFPSGGGMRSSEKGPGNDANCHDLTNFVQLSRVRKTTTSDAHKAGAVWHDTFDRQGQALHITHQVGNGRLKGLFEHLCSCALHR